MKKYLKLLETVSLFHNIKTDDLLKIINCLGSNIKDYKKDDIIQLAGEPVTQVGIILAGKIQVIREDFIGNRLILADLSEGDLFSETLHLPTLSIARYRSGIFGLQNSCNFLSKYG